MRLEVATHGDASRGVERSQRLVEQQHARIGRQGTGQCHPLAFATRKLGRPGAGPAPESDPIDPLRRAPSALRAARAASPQAERHVVLDIEVGKEEVVLEHVADGSLLGGDVASAR